MVERFNKPTDEYHNTYEMVEANLEFMRKKVEANEKLVGLYSQLEDDESSHVEESPSMTSEDAKENDDKK